ncbi:MAG: HNH endonuclease signature motif containing protein [Rhodocyclaceae bacterium]|nr:HNH endonuclease signature motif containing protein [Rhodocyclaceae bacterium]
MGKGYRGKLCVYCLEAEAEDGDHVLSRQFVLPEHRHNLPKVPACKRCNNEKSKLEHYLTTVMPFGGRHGDAGRILAEQVPGRLVRNERLCRELAAGTEQYLVSENGGLWEPSMTVPLDGRALEGLFEYMTRGLAWHHWRLTFGPGFVVRAAFLSEAASRLFEGLMARNGERVNGKLGGNALDYEGVKANDGKGLTVWRMSLYRAVVAGDRGGTGREERSSTSHCITAPKNWPTTAKFLEMLGD